MTTSQRSWQKMEEREEEEPSTEETGWVRLHEVVMEAAEEVCGVTVKTLENPWMIGKEVKMMTLRREISECLERRNRAGGRGEEEEEERA